MKFPYGCFAKRKDPAANFAFSAYVTRRSALQQATGALPLGKQIAIPYPASSPTGEKVLDWLYSLLSVLDTKASALMRLNSVMVAAAAFMLNPQYKATMLVKSLVASSAFGSTISIALCLLVASVDWPFLGLVTEVKNGTGNTECDFTEEFFHLQGIATFRERCFQRAWFISFLSTGAFLIAISAFLYGILRG